MGPGPFDRSETTSGATPIAPLVGRDFGARSHVRPLAGLAMVVLIGVIVAFSVGLFRGSFTDAVPVTVVSDRAGLVMNPDAKVKMRDIQVGKVDSIESLPNGRAAIHLAMNPDDVSLIPSNVGVNIASSTVFGAKYVELVPPTKPSGQQIQAGQTLEGQHVTVEINTVFDRLTSVLSTIEPEKLNQTLGALATSLNGRGEKLGQALTDFDHFLATVEPSLPNLSHTFDVAPDVLDAYGSVAPELISTVDSATTISKTLVDQQHNLDAFLVSAIGLADMGNDVVGANRQGLTDALNLLVPTTDLLNEYAPSLNCTLLGIVPIAKATPNQYPGVYSLAGLSWGAERYRYPGDLPKVAATGGPHCADLGLPNVPFEGRPPYLVADTGANPYQYGNQQLLLNADFLKQLLYGPLDGPPRNSAQIGQPG